MNDENHYVYDTDRPPTDRTLTPAERALQHSLSCGGIKRIEVYESRGVSRFTYTYDDPASAERPQKHRDGQRASRDVVTFTFDAACNRRTKIVEQHR